MAFYRGTCPLKALQRDLPMQPPLILLEIVSFWHTCLYSGCVHMKKEKLDKAVKAIKPSISCHYANRPHHSLPKWISWGWRYHQPYARQGMTPDFQICHLYWLYRWRSEVGQRPSAARNWRKWVKRSQSLLLTEALQQFITLLTSHL